MWHKILEKPEQAAAVCEKSKAVTTEYTEYTEENLLGMERLGSSIRYRVL